MRNLVLLAALLRLVSGAEINQPLGDSGDGFSYSFVPTLIRVTVSLSDMRDM